MQQLEQLYARGQTHELIYCAHRVLGQHPQAPGVAFLTLKALVGEGLGGPARELLQLRRDLPRDEPTVAALIEQVDGLPHGRVPFSERRAVFDANCQALAQRGDFSESLLESLEAALKGVHLFATSRGDHLLSTRLPGQLRQWLTLLCSRQSERQMQLPEHGKLGPLGIIGVADGELFGKLLELTHNVFLTRSHPLYIVEPDVTRFAAWLHCADQRELLNERRVLFFVGPDAIDLLRQMLEAEPNLPLPQQYITHGGKSAEMKAVEQMLAEVNQVRLQALETLTAKLRAREVDRDAAYWSERWQTPGLVLAITSRFTTVLQYSTRATLAAFEELGHKTELLIEDDDHHVLSQLGIARRVHEVDPDLIVLLDHLRYEHPYQPQRTPWWCWIQDPLSNLMKPEAGASLGEFDFVSGYHRQRCIDEFGYSAERFFSHVIPVSEAVFHTDRVAPEVAQQVGGDLVYVGHLTQTAAAYHTKLRQDVPVTLRGLVDAFWEDVHARLSSGDYIMQNQMGVAVQQLASEHNIRLSEGDAVRLTDFGLFRLYDLAFREQALAWAADWAQQNNRRLRLYGKGWEQLTGFAPFAAGPVEHGEPLRQVYASTPLVLQINPSGFMNQRTYEALLSGALVLVRYTPNNFAGMSVTDYAASAAAGTQLPDCAVQLFPQLAEVVFHNAEELSQKADRFLNDVAARESLQAAFAQIVREKFTYAHLIRWLRDEMHQQLKAQAAQTTAAPTTTAERACV